MNPATLARNQRPPASRDWRRAGAMLVSAAIIGLVWHFARPAILIALAKDSLGNYARASLIESALLGIPLRDPAQIPYLMGAESCAEGVVLARAADASQEWWRIMFFDRELRRICECQTVGRYFSGMGDRDRDGCMEMETWSNRENVPPAPTERGIEIVRETERGVEWVGTVAIDIQ